MLTKTRCHLKR